MIQKVQTLQKRLIAKTEEVVEADLLIQEKEKLYVELKNILARQPGPEVAEQLSIYQVLCSSRCVLIGLLYKPHPDGCQHRLETLLRLTPYPIGSCVLPPCPCIFDCALAVDGALHVSLQAILPLHVPWLWHKAMFPAVCAQCP